MTKILVVDDQVHIRELMSKTLKMEGFEVTTVPSANQAEEVISKEQFALIILDIELGEESGITLLKKIRESNKEIPIVIYSGCITPEIETEAKTAGANEVLRKDIGMTQLAKQINKIVNVKDRIAKGISITKQKPILLVDDQENIRNLLKTFFNRKGYDVLEAENGERALELARSSEFSVALLDMEMTGIDGLETLKGLLEINPKLGVVMATGVQDDDKVRKAIDLGAYGYVLKPFDFLYIELVVMSRLAIAEGE